LGEEGRKQGQHGKFTWVFRAKQKSKGDWGSQVVGRGKKGQKLFGIRKKKKKHFRGGLGVAPHLRVVVRWRLGWGVVGFKKKRGPGGEKHLRSPGYSPKNLWGVRKTDINQTANQKKDHVE